MFPGTDIGSEKGLWAVLVNIPLGMYDLQYRTPYMYIVVVVSREEQKILREAQRTLGVVRYYFLCSHLSLFQRNLAADAQNTQ